MDYEPYLYDAEKYPWFSPRYILQCYDRLIAIHDENVTKNDFKKAHEARIVAILMLGMYKLQGIPYFIQTYKEGTSPDIVTIRLTERQDKPILAEFNEVEVVTYESHAKENNVADFIINTKLSNKKDYDDKTIILCNVNKDKTYIDYKTIFNKLKGKQPKPHIYIIGIINTKDQIYEMFQVWPLLGDKCIINLFESANSYTSLQGKHIIHLIRSGEKTITFKQGSFKKATVYEVFDLDEQKIRKKYPPISELPSIT